MSRPAFGVSAAEPLVLDDSREELQRKDLEAIAELEAIREEREKTGLR